MPLSSIQKRPIVITDDVEPKVGDMTLEEIKECLKYHCKQLTSQVHDFEDAFKLKTQEKKGISSTHDRSLPHRTLKQQHI